MSALAALRAATAEDHRMVDAAFARFDLGDPASYAGFLQAHARVLPAVEQAIGSPPGLPPLRSRAPMLAEDLAGMGVAMPGPLPVAPPADDAAAFGAAYVIEGSRLGGGMLARAVAPDLPRAYLSATHLSGEWRAFGQALDAASTGEDWNDAAIAAAKRTFALYAEAAGSDVGSATAHAE